MTEREQEVLTEIQKILTVSLEATETVTPADRLADNEVLDSLGLITLAIGLENRFKPKFVRRYGSAFEDQVAAIAGYAQDTRAGTFPSEDESYLANDQLTEALGLYGSSRS